MHRNTGHSSPGRRRDRRLGQHQNRVQLGTVVRDKGRAYVEVRIRLPGVDHRFIPLEEEDRVRETGRNDGKADVFCGVPQGSVLGRLLWNIAYDRVLTRTVLAEGVSLTCNADDTLLLATGRGWAEIRERAETGRWRPSGASDSGCLC